MPATREAPCEVADRERFERLYGENFRAVLHYALARTDPERAKDVTAETFLVAWRRLDDVPADPRSWLLGVAHRVLASQFRSDSRREALVLRLQTAHRTEAGEGDLASLLEERELVLSAFAGLRERDREVLRLVAWDGLEAAEAASVLGVSRLAFAVRLHRARRRLARGLEPETVRESRLPGAQKTQRRRHLDAHS